MEEKPHVIRDSDATLATPVMVFKNCVEKWNYRCEEGRGLMMISMSCHEDEWSRKCRDKKSVVFIVIVQFFCTTQQFCSFVLH